MRSELFCSEAPADEAQQAEQLPAIERLKAAAAESGDEHMSVTVAELESELAELREQIAIADTKAIAAEANLASSKDQYLRLNADFENFRRRTVRAEADRCSRGQQPAQIAI
jgi:molecular chaperone GrpE